MRTSSMEHRGQQTASRNNTTKLVRCGLSLVLLTCGFAITSRAQQPSASVPQFEVAGAYSYIRANSGNLNGAFNLNGGSGSLTYNATDRISVIGEFGAYRFSGLPSGLTSTMYTYLFGPRISFRRTGRITLFAQGLLGGGRLNASSGGVDAGENSFAMVLGGGADLKLRGHFAIRLVEADYLLTRFEKVSGSSATQNNVRFSSGLVFRFGSR